MLQIFIEKIVETIDSFAQKLKILTRDDLKLWVDDQENEESDEEEEKNLNELNYSINGIDLNLIFKMQTRMETTEGFKKSTAESAKASEEPETKDKNV